MTIANRFLLAIMVLVVSVVSASAFAEEFSHS